MLLIESTNNGWKVKAICQTRKEAGSVWSWPVLNLLTCCIEGSGCVTWSNWTAGWTVKLNANTRSSSLALTPRQRKPAWPLISLAFSLILSFAWCSRSQMRLARLKHVALRFMMFIFLEDISVDHKTTLLFAGATGVAEFSSSSPTSIPLLVCKNKYARWVVCPNPWFLKTVGEEKPRWSTVFIQILQYVSEWNFSIT